MASGTITGITFSAIIDQPSLGYYQSAQLTGEIGDETLNLLYLSRSSFGPRTVGMAFNLVLQERVNLNGYGFRLSADDTLLSVPWQIAQDNLGTNFEVQADWQALGNPAATGRTFTLLWDSDGVPEPALTINRGTVSADVGGLDATVTGRIAVRAGAVSAALGGLSASVTPNVLQILMGEVDAGLGGLTASVTGRAFEAVRRFGEVSADLGGLGAAVTGAARAPTVRDGTVAAGLGGLSASILPSPVRVSTVRAALGGLDFAARSVTVIRRRFGFVRPSLGGLSAFPRGDVAISRMRGTVRADVGGLDATMRGSKRPAPMPTNFRDAFILSQDNVDIPVDALEVSDATVRLTPRVPIRFGSQVRVEYVDPAGLDILDRAGNPLASFREQVVENEVMDPDDAVPPMFERAVTDEEGTEVSISFTEGVRLSQLPPGPVRDLILVEVTGTTAEIVWERAETTDDTDPADYWEVRHREADGAWSAWRRVDAPEAELTGLSALTEYDVEVRGIAGGVDGPAVSLDVVTSAPLPPGPAAETVSYAPGGRLTASWTPVAGAAVYEVDIRVGAVSDPATVAWLPLGDGQFTGNAVNGTPDDLMNLPSLDELGRNRIDLRVRARDSADRLLTRYGVIAVYMPPPLRGTVMADVGGVTAGVTGRSFLPTIRRGTVVRFDQPAQTVTVVTPDLFFTQPLTLGNVITYQAPDVTVDVAANSVSGTVTIPERTATDVDDPNNSIKIPSVEGMFIAPSVSELDSRVTWPSVTVQIPFQGDQTLPLVVPAGQMRLDFTSSLPALGGLAGTATGGSAAVPIRRATLAAALGGVAASLAGVSASPLGDGPDVGSGSYRRTSSGLIVLVGSNISGIGRYEFQLRYTAAPSSGLWVTIGFGDNAIRAFSVGGSQNVPGQDFTGDVEARIRGVTAGGVPATRWGASRVLATR